MELRSQLTPKLKSLRLSGILETLDVRNQQAIEEKCTYVEFLLKLVEDEVERRTGKQLSLRLRRSSLDPMKTLETFNFSFNAAINRQQIYDLATCAFVERAESVFLIGPAGVGKSHIAHALGHEACRRGFDVLFTRTSEMLANLHGGRADGTYDRRLGMYQRPDVLILDDLGLKPMRPPAAEDLFEVIEGRYGHGAIVLTTNRAFCEWPELFDNAVLASAALDRLAHGATQLVIQGDSYRSKGPRSRVAEPVGV
ncbi:MAG TPA: IS21-like element helper ATPase IstB [Nitrospiraceae bacterium]|nr:IS21-like element helper ATPase IstB [Nitrospiraceae bacterium]